MALFGQKKNQGSKTEGRQAGSAARSGSPTETEQSASASGRRSKVNRAGRNTHSVGTGTTTDGASPSSRGKAVATIGESIIFKGELSGKEDLEINGTVEGDLKLPENTLTVGQTGHLKASVTAKCILVIGRVTGDISATDRIEIEASGIVEGDIRAPRLLVQEGAVMNGTIEMTSQKTATASKAPESASPPRSASAATGTQGTLPQPPN